MDKTVLLHFLDVVKELLALGVAGTVFLSRRQKQNVKLVDMLVKEVRALSGQVETTKTVVGLHKMDIQENTKSVRSLSAQVAKLQEMLPSVQELLQKFLAWVERDKGIIHPLEATPIGQGKTVIKKK